ncbi:MAG TPA: DUF481 domain-containing protein [Gemmatimonadales bacterium]|jgi:putative salt-induced outer membrane protein YdiY|nr:DUF481 domain-containing protein [Gemmatimonadales bacterium]
MFILALPLALLLSGDSTAPKAPPPKSPVIKFTGDVGYVSTGGNTSVQTLNLGDKVSAKFSKVTLSEEFAVVQGRSDGVAVASNWTALVRSDFALRQTVAAYAAETFERNVFAGLASRMGTTAGLAAQVVKTSHDKLAVEGGVSYTAQRGVSVTGDNEDFFGGRAATAYTHQLGPRASIAQTVELLPNFRQGADLRINSESDLLAPLAKRVAMKLSYVIHYDGVPQPGYLSTDRLFTSGIQVTL